MTNSFLPKHGGYQKLRSFQIARSVYDGTVVFCDRFIDRRSRTRDQMIQAARSGVQNIAEGSLASATSKETEIKLTNVARASLGELQLDYEDFLRQHRLRLWHKDSPEALAVRGRYRQGGGTKSSDRSGASEKIDALGLQEASPEAAANTVLCLIHQASALLRNQIRRLEQDFLCAGGVRERMTQARLSARDPGPAVPACPQCGRRMRRRGSASGLPAGESFWGCSGFPDCRATLPGG